MRANVRTDYSSTGEPRKSQVRVGNVTVGESHGFSGAHSCQRLADELNEYPEKMRLVLDLENDR